MNRQLIFWSGLIGALLFAVASIAGGLQIEGYNPIGQYISESYATGIPNATYLQYMYIVSGVFLFIFGLWVPSVLPKSRSIKIAFILFAIFYGLGTMVTGYFPCDPGCRTDSANPSISQFIHNTAGFLTYSVVPFCLIAIGISLRKFIRAKKLGTFSLVCGTLSLVFVLLLFGNPSGPYIGLFQRTIESGFLIWILYCSFFVIRTRKFSTP